MMNSFRRISVLTISAVYLLGFTFSDAALAKARTKKSEPVVTEEQSETGKTSIERPNVIALELLGRGGLYSLNYDRSVSEVVSIGGGIAAYPLDTLGASGVVTIFPLYGNFYFSPGPHRGFVTAGVDIVFATAHTDDGNFKGSGAAAVLGGGYEYRGDGGFLFRVSPYLLIGSSVQVWGGLSFGYAF